MELKDVILAMRNVLDLIEHPERFGPELRVCVAQEFSEAIDALQTAQRELIAHAARTTVLDAVETVQ